MQDADLLIEHEAYMRQAMETACQNLQRPFGAVLVDTRNGEVVAEAVNRSYRNPVAHSELEVIHEASKRGDDVRWSDYTLYVTAEPCPMCMAGILWTGIPRVVYGTSMATLHRLGYRHIGFRAAQVIDAAEGLSCELIGGILETDCDALFGAAIKLEKKSKS
jgi:tRNA(Arg) A34 adenosine deaminase TadA